LCHVVWLLDTNISEECAASVFRVHKADGSGKLIEALFKIFFN